MKLLALDTACSDCSAALWADGAIAASRTVAMQRGHAEALVPMVLDVVRESAVPFSELDAVAVTLGPGSFTGLRTGLATAKGLALAHQLPVVGVTSLEAVALAARLAAPSSTKQLPLVVALETRRDSVYLQSFAPDGSVLNEPSSRTLDQAKEELSKQSTVVAGDAASRIVSAMGKAEKNEQALVIESVTGPDAVFVAEIAAGRWSGAAAPGSGRPLTPLYIQPPEAKRPVAGGRLRS